MASVTNKAVAVVGSSGFVGQATIRALSKAYENDSSISIRAVTRDPASSKLDTIRELPGVTVVAGDVNDPEKLKDALDGVASVLIVTPGDVNRTMLAVAGVDAAKDAGAAHIAVISVTTAADDTKDTLFGGQLIPLETHVHGLGVPYTILRLPLFIDNFAAAAGSIMSAGKMYGPIRPDAPFTPVAVNDVGECAARVLLEGPGKHGVKTYHLHSTTHTMAGVAEAFSRVLGMPVEYVQTSFESAREFFLAALPEWQVDGVLQLCRLFEAGSPVTNNTTGDIAAIVGHSPMTAAAWCHLLHP